MKDLMIARAKVATTMIPRTFRCAIFSAVVVACTLAPALGQASAPAKKAPAPPKTAQETPQQAQATENEVSRITIPPLPAFQPQQPKRIELPNGLVVFL